VLQGANGRLPSERVERNRRDHLFQAPGAGLIGAEEATFLDNSMDGGFYSRQNRIGDQ
jgi:hypothetical protein